MNIHEAAAKGFQRGAADYEKGRPSFPAEVLDTLRAGAGLEESSKVVDLGAGTGKFTKLLFEVVEPGGVIAVEPVRAMREAFARNFPGQTILEGTAESVPRPDQSVDLVTVAQAFHWFDAGPALDEIARVLRPDGALALVWNTRDERVEWTHRINGVLDRLAGDAPRFRRDDPGWHGAIDAHPAFGPIETASFPNPVAMDLDTMLARIASTSYVSALPDDERAEVLAEVARLTTEVLIREQGPRFVEAYRTDVFWCRRR